MSRRKIIGSTLTTIGTIALVGFYSSYNEGLTGIGASANLEFSPATQYSEFKWEIIRHVGLLAVGLIGLGAGGYLLSRQRHKAHRIILDFTGLKQNRNLKKK